MSHWDGQQVVRWPSEPDRDHPGWTWLDCGCCAGIQWSAGYEAVECSTCGATGLVCRHDSSGTLALYPGGPFVGRDVSAVAA